MVVEFGHKHAEDNVEAFQCADCETWGCVSLDGSRLSEDNLTIAELPKVQVQDDVDGKSCLWFDQNGCKHCHVDQHAALQEQVQRPLRAVVVVPAYGPRLHLSSDQRVEGSPDGWFLSVPALSDPRRVDVLGHVVSVDIRHEPCKCRSDHGRKDQSARPSKRAFRYAVEGSISVASARTSNWANRIHISRDEEEQGHGRAAADCEAEEG